MFPYVKGQTMTVSKTGIWVNTATGNVVHSEPDEGYVVVLPGHEIDVVAQAVIAGHGGNRATEDVNSKNTKGN